MTTSSVATYAPCAYSSTMLFNRVWSPWLSCELLIAAIICFLRRAWSVQTIIASFPSNVATLLSFPSCFCSIPVGFSIGIKSDGWNHACLASLGLRLFSSDEMEWKLSNHSTWISGLAVVVVIGEEPCWRMLELVVFFHRTPRALAWEKIAGWCLVILWLWARSVIVFLLDDDITSLNAHISWFWLAIRLLICVTHLEHVCVCACSFGITFLRPKRRGVLLITWPFWLAGGVT